mmetsp:Transcript_6118/g.15841  ORF Transcript_6118/g.15841 Transcript_6118/m.15841 type:complete len:217 (-) Transcript_6118:519-1169(-)
MCRVHGSRPSQRRASLSQAAEACARLVARLFCIHRRGIPEHVHHRRIRAVEEHPAHDVMLPLSCGVHQRRRLPLRGLAVDVRATLFDEVLHDVQMSVVNSVAERPSTVAVGVHASLFNEVAHDFEVSTRRGGVQRDGCGALQIARTAVVRVKRPEERNCLQSSSLLRLCGGDCGGCGGGLVWCGCCVVWCGGLWSLYGDEGTHLVDVTHPRGIHER